jgi:hypothetical protein
MSAMEVSSLASGSGLDVSVRGDGAAHDAMSLVVLWSQAAPNGGTVSGQHHVVNLKVLHAFHCVVATPYWLGGAVMTR